jgi:Rieske Fe-S protein
MSESHLDRREFAKVVLAFLSTIGGMIVGVPAVGYLISPAIKTSQQEAWVPLGPLENYPIGAPTLFSFTRSKVNGWEKTVNSYGVFVLRKSESDVLVLSNRCTHLSCRVNWDEAAQHYQCPCHDAQFGAGGEVLGGPPPRPLDAYTGEKIKIEDGTLFIHFEEG